MFSGTVDSVRSSGSRGGGRTLKVTAKGFDSRGKVKEAQGFHKDDATLQDFLDQAAKNLDMVVALAGRLRRRCEIAPAMRAAGSAHLVHPCRVRVERAGDPGPALAPPPLSIARDGGLAPLARRHAGVLRGLRRQIEPGLQLGHLLRQTQHQLDQPAEITNFILEQTLRTDSLRTTVCLFSRLIDIIS